MKHKHFILALAAFAVLTLLPATTRADSLIFGFTPPAYAGPAGSVVTLFGTFNNGPGAITFTGYEAILEAGLSLSGAVQPFDSIAGMASGATLGPVALFNVQIAPGTPPGTIFSFAANQFRIFYSTSTGNDNEVAGNFQIRVEGGQPAIPEPASMVLLGTGLAGVAARLRKRWRAKTK